MESQTEDQAHEELLNTIEYFYTKAPSEGKEAFKRTEQVLINFTKQEEAWASWFTILRNPELTQHQLFFAANTLKSKMIFDYDGFRNEYGYIAEKFGDEILSLIKLHCGTSHAAVVLSSLWLALAIFWVRLIQKLTLFLSF